MKFPPPTFLHFVLKGRQLLGASHCNSKMQTPFSDTVNQALFQMFLDDDRGVDIKPDYGNVASVVFSSPQVAQVGVNEDKAVEEYGDVDIFTSTFS